MQDISSLLTSDDAESFDIEYKGQSWHFRIKKLPWVAITSILSRSMEYDAVSKTTIADIGKYYSLYLQKALVEAPWEIRQTSLVVPKLETEFGKLLQAHIPDPFEVERSDPETKKG